MKPFTGMTTLSDRLFKTFIGIEFKDEVIILTCLKNSWSGISLLSSSTFPLRDDDETIAEINNFIAPYLQNTKNVFVSIPENWAITKFIEVPSTKGKGGNALSQMMRYEIERHIPYQAEDIFYDFQIVNKNKTTYTVVFTSVHKGRIDYVKGFLEKISLIPQVITLSPFAALNFIEFSETSVGGWQGFLGVMKKPRIWGGKGDIYISLFLDKNNAQFSIQKNGFCTQLKTFVLDLDKPVDALVDDISSELADMLHGTPMNKINKLILSGHVASLSELSDTLSSKLGINVQTINRPKLFEKIDGTEVQELIPSSGSCYSGLGIGALKINLLPHKKRLEAEKFVSLTTVISISLILFLIIGIYAGELINNKRALTKIEEKLKKNKPVIEAIEKISKELNALKKNRFFLLREKENDIALDALSELTKITPVKAWYTYFDYKEIYDRGKRTSKRELTISGFAESSSELISILEDSPFFEEVRFAGPTTKRKDKEGFKIKAVIVKPQIKKEIKQKL